VCQTAMLPTCDGLVWCFPADMSDEDGLYYDMDKAADMYFYEVEEDGRAMKVKRDFLGYWKESLKEGIARVDKGWVILDSKWLDWKIMKLKLIYTQRLMIGFETWMQCRDCIDYDAKEALNVPAVSSFQDINKPDTSSRALTLYIGCVLDVFPRLEGVLSLSSSVTRRRANVKEGDSCAGFGSLESSSYNI
jgi:hypothetical protein